eukprot:5505634-Alexandrium_andersonii.AAC.1
MSRSRCWSDAASVPRLGTAMRKPAPSCIVAERQCRAASQRAERGPILRSAATRGPLPRWPPPEGPVVSHAPQTRRRGPRRPKAGPSLASGTRR